MRISDWSSDVCSSDLPEGGALAGIVEKFIASAKAEAKSNNQDTEAILRQKLEQLTELVNGYDFADVIAAYWRGHEEGNEQLKSDAIRWLRGDRKSVV